MNWTDITVLFIIAIFTIIGLKNGFLYSVFRLLSYVLSVIFAIKFYPVLSGILQKTELYSYVKEAILKGIVKQQELSATAFKEKAAQTIVNDLKVPSFLKDTILDNVTNKDIFGVQGIMDAIASEIAMIVINILSVFLIYVIIRFSLAFLKVLIKAISRLPVFKQLDKTGGFILGAIEGILVVYIVCTLLILFSAFPKFSTTIDSIEDSQIAKRFYNDNFIVSWISPD